MELIFYRFDNFDNSKCVRKLPHNGKSWWVIRAEELELIEEYFDYINSHKIHKMFHETYTAVHEKDMKYNQIYSLDYRIANDYVLGNSDVKPKLLKFDRDKHPQRWIWTQKAINEAGINPKSENIDKIMIESGLEIIAGKTIEPAQDYQVLIL